MSHFTKYVIFQSPGHFEAVLALFLFFVPADTSVPVTPLGTDRSLSGKRRKLTAEIPVEDREVWERMRNLNRERKKSASRSRNEFHKDDQGRVLSPVLNADNTQQQTTGENQQGTNQTVDISGNLRSNRNVPPQRRQTQPLSSTSSSNQEVVQKPKPQRKRSRKPNQKAELQNAQGGMAALGSTEAYHSVSSAPYDSASTAAYHSITSSSYHSGPESQNSDQPVPGKDVAGNTARDRNIPQAQDSLTPTGVATAGSGFRAPLLSEDRQSKVHSRPLDSVSGPIDDDVPSLRADQRTSRRERYSTASSNAYASAEENVDNASGYETAKSSSVVRSDGSRFGSVSSNNYASTRQSQKSSSSFKSTRGEVSDAERRNRLSANSSDLYPYSASSANDIQRSTTDPSDTDAGLDDVFLTESPSDNAPVRNDEQSSNKAGHGSIARLRGLPSSDLYPSSSGVSDHLGLSSSTSSSGSTSGASSITQIASQKFPPKVTHHRYVKRSPNPNEKILVDETTVQQREWRVKSISQTEDEGTESSGNDTQPAPAEVPVTPPEPPTIQVPDVPKQDPVDVPVPSGSQHPQIRISEPPQPDPANVPEPAEPPPIKTSEPPKDPPIKISEPPKAQPIKISEPPKAQPIKISEPTESVQANIPQTPTPAPITVPETSKPPAIKITEPTEPAKIKPAPLSPKKPPTERQKPPSSPKKSPTKLQPGLPKTDFTKPSVPFFEKPTPSAANVPEKPQPGLGTDFATQGKPFEMPTQPIYSTTPAPSTQSFRVSGIPTQPPMAAMPTETPVYGQDVGRAPQMLTLSRNVDPIITPRLASPGRTHLGTIPEVTTLNRVPSNQQEPFIVPHLDSSEDTTSDSQSTGEPFIVPQLSAFVEDESDISTRTVSEPLIVPDIRQHRNFGHGSYEASDVIEPRHSFKKTPSPGNPPNQAVCPRKLTPGLQSTRPAFMWNPNHPRMTQAHAPNRAWPDQTVLGSQLDERLNNQRAQFAAQSAVPSANQSSPSAPQLMGPSLANQRAPFASQTAEPSLSNQRTPFASNFMGHCSANQRAPFASHSEGSFSRSLDTPSQTFASSTPRGTHRFFNSSSTSQNASPPQVSHGFNNSAGRGCSSSKEVQEQLIIPDNINSRNFNRVQNTVRFAPNPTFHNQSMSGNSDQNSIPYPPKATSVNQDFAEPVSRDVLRDASPNADGSVSPNRRNFHKYIPPQNLSTSSTSRSPVNSNRRRHSISSGPATSTPFARDQIFSSMSSPPGYPPPPYSSREDNNDGKKAQKSQSLNNDGTILHDFVPSGEKFCHALLPSSTNQNTQNTRIKLDNTGARPKEFSFSDEKHYHGTCTEQSGQKNTQNNFENFNNRPEEFTFSDEKFYHGIPTSTTRQNNQNTVRFAPNPTFLNRSLSGYSDQNSIRSPPEATSGIHDFPGPSSRDAPNDASSESGSNFPNRRNFHKYIPPRTASMPSTSQNPGQNSQNAQRNLDNGTNNPEEFTFSDEKNYVAQNTQSKQCKDSETIISSINRPTNRTYEQTLNRSKRPNFIQPSQQQRDYVNKTKILKPKDVTTFNKEADKSHSNSSEPIKIDSNDDEKDKSPDYVNKTKILGRGEVSQHQGTSSSSQQSQDQKVNDKKMSTKNGPNTDQFDCASSKPTVLEQFDKAGLSRPRRKSSIEAPKGVGFDEMTSTEQMIHNKRQNLPSGRIIPSDAAAGERETHITQPGTRSKENDGSANFGLRDEYQQSSDGHLSEIDNDRENEIRMFRLLQKNREDSFNDHLNPEETDNNEDDAKAHEILNFQLMRELREKSGNKKEEPEVSDNERENAIQQFRMLQQRFEHPNFKSRSTSNKNRVADTKKTDNSDEDFSTHEMELRQSRLLQQPREDDSLQSKMPNDEKQGAKTKKLENSDDDEWETELRQFHMLQQRHKDANYKSKSPRDKNRVADTKKPGKPDDDFSQRETELRQFRTLLQRREDSKSPRDKNRVADTKKPENSDDDEWETELRQFLMLQQQHEDENYKSKSPRDKNRVADTKKPGNSDDDEWETEIRQFLMLQQQHEDENYKSKSPRDKNRFADTKKPGNSDDDEWETEIRQFLMLQQQHEDENYKSKSPRDKNRFADTKKPGNSDDDEWETEIRQFLMLQQQHEDENYKSKSPRDKDRFADTKKPGKPDDGFSQRELELRQFRMLQQRREDSKSPRDKNRVAGNKKPGQLDDGFSQRELELRQFRMLQQRREDSKSPRDKNRVAGNKKPGQLDDGFSQRELELRQFRMLQQRREDSKSPRDKNRVAGNKKPGQLDDGFSQRELELRQFRMLQQRREDSKSPRDKNRVAGNKKPGKLDDGFSQRELELRQFRMLQQRREDSKSPRDKNRVAGNKKPGQLDDGFSQRELELRQFRMLQQRSEDLNDNSKSPKDKKRNRETEKPKDEKNDEIIDDVPEQKEKPADQSEEKLRGRTDNKAAKSALKRKTVTTLPAAAKPQKQAKPKSKSPAVKDKAAPKFEEVKPRGRQAAKDKAPRQKSVIPTTAARNAKSVSKARKQPAARGRAAGKAKTPAAKRKSATISPAALHKIQFGQRTIKLTKFCPLANCGDCVQTECTVRQSLVDIKRRFKE